MLVLVIKKGKKLFIGEAIVTILETGINRIRVGIEAPRSIQVRREGNRPIDPNTTEELYRHD